MTRFHGEKPTVKSVCFKAKSHRSERNNCVSKDGISQDVKQTHSANEKSEGQKAEGSNKAEINNETTEQKYARLYGCDSVSLNSTMKRLLPLNSGYTDLID